MRIKCRGFLFAAALMGILFLTACAAPWNNENKEDEELTLPDTSTVAGAQLKEERDAEPAALSAFERFASVRIATPAVVRVYVDTAGTDASVVYVQALNEKGARLMEDWDTDGMDFAEFAGELAERTVNKGYANDFNAHVSIEVERIDTADAAGELEAEATEAFTSVFATHGIEAIYGNREEAVGE